MGLCTQLFVESKSLEKIRAFLFKPLRDLPVLSMLSVGPEVAINGDGEVRWLVRGLELHFSSTGERERGCVGFRLSVQHFWSRRRREKRED